MMEFFMGNSLCFYAYVLTVLLIVVSVFLKKLKGLLLILALLIFVADISALMLFGFSLAKCAIVCGICVILTLVSVRRGGR